MQLNLRIPPEKEAMILKAAHRPGKSKTSFIMEAIDEKLGLHKSRQKLIREMAGWLTHPEAEELRESVKIFEQINEEDWD
jgi:hypothetical protein